MQVQALLAGTDPTGRFPPYGLGLYVELEKVADRAAVRVLHRPAREHGIRRESDNNPDE